MVLAAAGGCDSSDVDAGDTEHSHVTGSSSTITTTSSTVDREVHLSRAGEELAAAVGQVSVSAFPRETLTSTSAACLGRAFVVSVGEDVLLDAGVTPQDLAAGRDVSDFGIVQTEAMTRSYLEAASRCVDAVAYAVALFVEESDISEEAEACLKERLSVDLARRLLIANIGALVVDTNADDLLAEVYGLCPSIARKA